MNCKKNDEQILSDETTSGWEQMQFPYPLNESSTYGIGISGSDIYMAVGCCIYKSKDNGSSWIKIRENLSDTIVTCIALKDTNIFVGTNYGIYHFTVSNNNWFAANNGFNQSGLIFDIVVNGKYIYASTLVDVYLSADNAKNWTPTTNGLSGLNFSNLSGNGSKLYASVSKVGINRVYRSNDKGATWSAVTPNLGTNSNEMISALAVYKNNIFAVCHDSIFICIENGKNWNSFNKSFAPRGRYIRMLTVVGSTLYVGTQVSGVWKRELDQ